MGQLKVLVNCKHSPSLLGERGQLPARKLLTSLKLSVSQLSRVRSFEVLTDNLITFTATENTNKQTSQPWSLYIAWLRKKITGKGVLQIFWKLKFQGFQNLFTQFFSLFSKNPHREKSFQKSLIKTILKSSRRASWVSNPFRNYQEQTFSKQELFQTSWARQEHQHQPTGSHSTAENQGGEKGGDGEPEELTRWGIEGETLWNLQTTLWKPALRTSDPSESLHTQPEAHPVTAHRPQGGHPGRDAWWDHPPCCPLLPPPSPPSCPPGQKFWASPSKPQRNRP